MKKNTKHKSKHSSNASNLSIDVKTISIYGFIVLVLGVILSTSTDEIAKFFGNILIAINPLVTITITGLPYVFVIAFTITGLVLKLKKGKKK